MQQQGIKALVLAAGLGQRLLPHTRELPKPLFPVAGRAVIDIIICRLIELGVSEIAVNTHHLHQKIEEFIRSRSYRIPVVIRCEPEILGTGGAIANFSDFFGNRDPFIIVNSDILTNIDIKEAAKNHKQEFFAATLILHDCPGFNKVRVDKDGLIRDFSGKPEKNERCLAFTGIQVVDPVIYDYIPKGTNVSSIDVYRKMINNGLAVRGWETSGHYWYDLGTPERYFRASADILASKAFKKAFGRTPESSISWSRLAGDGSDRRWFRLKAGEQSLVLADHGIQTDSSRSQFDSFVLIGCHLHKKCLSVPEIFIHDRFSGIVFLSDLGNTPLQEAVRAARSDGEVEALYRQAIDKALEINIYGAKDFDPGWCYQEPSYSRETIIEKEGMYFVRAFLQNWLGMKDIPEPALVPEFERLADIIEASSIKGFMHRDMQSRNIMITGQGCCFIDFQAGRQGPIQYDLASLIEDPYTDLGPVLRKKLLTYAEKLLSEKLRIDKHEFEKGYLYCAIARSLQALGAYGHLSTAGRKPHFAEYIQPALNNLSRLLSSANNPSLPYLAQTAARAQKRIAK